MSLLDPDFNYAITIGQKYMVSLAIKVDGFDVDFHRSMWNEKFFEYDWASGCGWFHKNIIVQAIKELPIEQLQCGQPYRYIKKIIRSYAKPKFQWAAKFTPQQSQISVRMGQSVVITLKVKDMGEKHWREYMRIYLNPQGHFTPF